MSTDQSCGSTPAVQPQSYHSPYSGYGYNNNNIGDMFMNNLIFQRFGDVMRGDMSLSPRNIIKLLLLLSLNELKDLFKKLLNNFIPFIKECPGYVTMIRLKILTWRVNRLDQDVMIPLPEVPRMRETVIEVSDDFMYALYNYITSFQSESSHEVYFHRSVLKVGVSNLKDCYFTEVISDLRISELEIPDRLEYNVDIHTNDPVGLTISYSPGNTDSSKYKSYMDLLTEDQQKMVKESITILAEHKIDSAVFANAFCAPHYSDCFTEYNIASMIRSKYPQFTLQETSFIIGIIVSLYRFVTPSNLVIRSKETLLSNRWTAFDKNHEYNLHDMGFNHNSPCKSVAIDTLPFGWISYQLSEINNVFGDFIVRPQSPAPSNNPSKTKQLTLLSNPNLVEQEFDKLLRKFVNDVSRFQKKSTSSIKINYLSVETKVTISEQDNPAYQQFLEKKKLLEEYRADPENKNQVFDLSSLDVPLKMIRIETPERVITSKPLNETRKSIDTLYLRQTDMDKLLNSLDQFHNKKDILTGLGLPNKLNVLLYGEPGTGKSTAIQTIATYLGRNIYYVDLKNAITNEDLQMMSEYVNKNVQNGGIIVIEDIDAMTDVVLKRNSKMDREPEYGYSDEKSQRKYPDKKSQHENLDRESQRKHPNEKSECRVDQLVSSQGSKLSLEYLLNMLQGTLTMDDSIVIVTTNYIDHLDPAFYRDGRFDVKIELKLCDHFQIQTIYQKFLNRRIPDDILSRIPENMYTPATIIFHIKDYLFNSEISDEMILERFTRNDS